MSIRSAKSAHRFDYGRLGEALVERGLIDRDVLAHVLTQIHSTRALLPEVLVRENLVSDWEVSRVACEIYHLPFLTVEQCPPSPTALDGYDVAYLRHFALVPLDRFGGLVTVIMPGLVPSDVLDGLRSSQSGRVMPVVGSVLSNRRWLEERFAPASKPGAGVKLKGPSIPLGPSTPVRGQEAPGPIPSAAADDEPVLQLGSADEDWGNLFDAGDEAVQLDLKKPLP